jgi:hypothetical protein
MIASRRTPPVRIAMKRVIVPQRSAIAIRMSPLIKPGSECTPYAPTIRSAISAGMPVGIPSSPAKITSAAIGTP